MPVRTRKLPTKNWNLMTRTSRVRLFLKIVMAWVACNLLPPSQAPAQIVPAGSSFRCTPTEAWDGDGPIWCAEGPKVRIAGVAARQMDGSSRPNQPCPPVNAIDARDRLVRLLGGPRGTRTEGHIVVRSATMTCRS